MTPLELPNADALLAVFDYDPATGLFVWKKRPNAKRSGRIAGSVSAADGYRRLCFGRRRILAHRAAWKIVYDEDADEVDHINGLRDDNRITNLRSASRRENQRNRRAYGQWPKGVYFCKRRAVFVAQITHPERKQYIGSFATAEEAHMAYQAEARRLFGDFSCVRPSKFMEVFG